MTETAKNQFKKMNRLHEILAAAIEDARGLDREAYTPDFSTWHTPYADCDGDSCSVCLGGAVIAGRCGVPIDEMIEPGDLGTETCRRLIALDSIRTGDWCEAWSGFHVTVAVPEDIKHLPGPKCGLFTDWNTFDRNINSLEDILPKLREIEDRALVAIDSARGVDRLGRSIDSTAD